MRKSNAILRGICGLGFIFLLFWTISSIVGAIYYSTWSPKFDLTDLHLRSFNVTPSGELSYDMDILITARHFSSLRRIEQFSYKIRTSHVGKRIGSSSIPGFYAIHNKTMTLASTQSVKGVQLATEMGEEILQGWNQTGRVALRVYIEGQIYTPLFLAMKKRGGWTCDVIVSPGMKFGEQIYDRLCCLMPSFCFKNLAQGAATQVYVAANPHLHGVSRKYFMDCNEHPLEGKALDSNLQNKLLKWTEDYH